MDAEAALAAMTKDRDHWRERAQRAETDLQERLSTIADLTEKMEIMNHRVAQMSRRLFGSSAEPHHPGQQVVEECRALLDSMAANASSTSGAEPSTDPDASNGTAAPDVAVAPDAGAGTVGGEGTPGVPSDVPTPNPAPNPAPTSAPTPAPPRAPRKPNRGRLPLPASIEKEVRRLEVPASERLDANGRPLPLLREEVTRKLDYRAPGFVEVTIIRPVYGIPFDDEPRIIHPPLPCIVEGGLPTDAVLAVVLTDKFADHLPLYRQQSRLERAGIPLSRATLMNWVKAGASALAPVVEAIAHSIRSKPVVHLDDTYLKVLQPGLGRTHQSVLWGYYAEDEFFCEYQRTRQACWPQEFLKDFTGTLLGDALSSHNGLFNDPRITPAGCMAHPRRKFEEAATNGERTACDALDIFYELYAIEKLLKPASDTERLRQRQRVSVPLMDRLEQLLTGWMTSQRPSSRVGMATRYTLPILGRLRQFTQDGRVPIDNNVLERCWRGVGIGRRNWLFAGSDRGGAWMAIMVSLVQSCRLVGVDPFPYFQHVFAALHTGGMRIDALTPKAYAQRLRSAVIAKS